MDIDESVESLPELYNNIGIKTQNGNCNHLEEGKIEGIMGIAK